MLRLVSLLILATFVMLQTAHAADPAAKAFVEAIYAQYRTTASPGVDIAGDEAVKRYFEPGLAALLIKDAEDADKKGDVPKLDGDPFIDAQDWQITDVKMALADTAKDRIMATVNFNNFKQPKSIKLDLVKIGRVWRIYDIVWPETSLRKLLTTP